MSLLALDVQIIVRVFIRVVLTSRVPHIKYVPQRALACALPLPPSSLGQVVFEVACLVRLPRTLMFIW